MNHEFFIVTGELDWSQPKSTNKMSDLKVSWGQAKYTMETATSFALNNTNAHTG